VEAHENNPFDIYDRVIEDLTQNFTVCSWKLEDFIYLCLWIDIYFV